MAVEIVKHIEHFFVILSLCILIASIVAFASSKKKTKDEGIKIKMWEKSISEVIEAAFLGNDKEILKAHWRDMGAKLVNTDELLAYEEAIVSLKNKFEGPVVQRYIDESKEEFNYLAYTYKNSHLMDRGAFAFLMADLHPGAKDGNTELAEVLLSYLDDADSGCMENVLLALCAIGYPQAIAQAFDIVVEKNWLYSSQLISDALTWTQGNRAALATYLATKAKRWNENIQVTIIRFVTNVSGEHAADFLDWLMEPDALTETKFALIRYFGRWIYAPAKMILIRITKEDQPLGFAIASTQVLKKYPGEDTKEALISALRSSNWDVRKNAALSLIELGADMDDVVEMNKTGDAYAAQMLGYYLQEKNTGRVSKIGDDARIDMRGAKQ